MEEQDARDRQPAQAVERGLMRQPRTAGLHAAHRSGVIQRLHGPVLLAARESNLDTLRPVKAFRRLLLVLGIAGLVGAYAKLRGKDEVPPTSGGWRELEGPDFR